MQNDRNGKVVISVTDDGIGFDREKLDDFMIRNEQYSTTGTLHEKGTGLGLSLVRECVHYLNAELEIESSPGHGTSVRIIAPVNEA